MSMLIEDYPFGKKPCKKGDIVTIRDTSYEITKIEPMVFEFPTIAINGQTVRMPNIVPRQSIVHYFQYLVTTNPNVQFSIERPEGQPHITVDAARQYLRSLYFNANTPATLFMSVLQGESVALRFIVAANQNITFIFYGYRLYVKKIGAPQGDVLDDLIDYSK